MTEAGEVTSEDWGTEGPKIGSIGMAAPNVSLKTVNPKTREILGPNQREEICIRGPTLMKGYIGVDSSTYLDQDRCLSGDLGYYDEDTYFYVVGRLKDIICFDGYQLESIIVSHPEVREAAVVGKPAGAYGEQPAAIVVLQPGSTLTQQQIQNYVAREVPPYMQLSGGVKFVSELPRNKMENYDTGETLTYKDFTDYAVSLSVALSNLGVTKGDVVAVGSEKRIMFLPTTLAVVLTGASYTPFDVRSGRAVLQYKLNLAKPSYFICSNSFWETYSDVLKSCNFIKTFIGFEEIVDIQLSIQKLILRHTSTKVESFEPAVVDGHKDVALILYSSGTTSMPKGVLITHYNCVVSCLPEKLPDESLKTAVLFGEWYHRYDTFVTYKFLSASIGRKVVFANNLTHQDTILKAIQDCKVNVAMVVPSAVSYLAKAKEVDKYNTSTLRLIFSTGCTLDPSLIETVKRRIPTVKNVLQTYGMTEAGEITSEDWGTKGPKIGSIGMASPNVSLKIVDPKTREILGPNRRGEICIRCPALMKGYIGMDSSSYLDQEGFFLTGDLGYYDEDTYFYFVDRLKDVIFYDGYQVDPTELESIILSHPEVREAAVVGKPAGAYGEQPVAIVVLQPGSTLTEQQLQNYVAGEVPPYMQLRGGVKFVLELPKNTMGKTIRYQLKEIL